MFERPKNTTELEQKLMKEALELKNQIRKQQDEIQQLKREAEYYRDQLGKNETPHRYPVPERESNGMW